ncbi:hypothetical protein B6A14_04490 [Polynucleobacter hirudinilacicola]|uniref:Uncharacterized protein n=1 Tax=Polynucleobacter hirudinilacicola TaxID=1743166 RepID=A0A210RVN4_9BURK|nr:hypothetical protein [Polynucleobacter hirudinilacicola]OWF65075.1 hypothetical protein B6A14_04490 [Polynucleobacter hirudinilacicola]
MSKWSQSVKKDDEVYVLHHTPQLMGNGKFASKLVIARHYPDRIEEFQVPLIGNPEFETEIEAAELGLKAGKEWVRDLG